MEEKFLYVFNFSSAGFFMVIYIGKKTRKIYFIEKHDKPDTFVISLVFLISFLNS